MSARYVVVFEHPDGFQEAYGTFGAERSRDVASIIRSASSRYSDSPRANLDVGVSEVLIERWPGIRALKRGAS